MRFVTYFGLFLIASAVGYAQLSGRIFSDFKDEGSKKSAAFSETVKVDEKDRPLLGVRPAREFSSGGQSSAAVRSVAADFDSDGVVDLIVADANGGARLLKGSAEFSQNRNTAASADLPPFAPTGVTLALGVAPDFLATGDYDLDGKNDLLAAAKGDRKLVFLGGDGQGRFSAAREIALAGTITALAAGQIGLTDEETDLAVAVATPKGARLLVFEHPAGTFRFAPEIVPLPAPATAIATGLVGRDGYADVALACGDTLVLVQGRGQVTPWDAVESVRLQRPPAIVSARKMTGRIDGLEIGRFTDSRENSIAVLTADGVLQTFEADRNTGTTNFRPVRSPDLKMKSAPFVPTGADGRNIVQIEPATIAPELDDLRADSRATAAEKEKEIRKRAEEKLAGLQKLPREKQAEILSRANAAATASRARRKENFLKTIAAVPLDVALWKERTVLRDARLAGLAGSGKTLQKAQISFSGRDDLVLIDAARRTVDIVAEPKNAAGLREPRVFSLEADSAPVAVLPLRLNGDARSDLIVLREGSGEPNYILSAPTTVIVVDTVADGESSCDGSPQPCTLRGAIERANQTPGGPSITFEIPGGGHQTIALNSQLPSITANGTAIFGPSETAERLIEIDGANAGVADGFKIQASNCQVSSLIINNFHGEYDENGSIHGGNAITIESTQIFQNSHHNDVLGNILGADYTGTVAKGNVNGVLIFDADENSVGWGNAQNIIAGNGNRDFPGYGIVVEAGNGNIFNGNRVGVGLSGTALGNTHGVFLSGANNVFGDIGPGGGIDSNTVSNSYIENPFNPTQCDGLGIGVAPVFSVDANGNPLENLTFFNRIRGARVGTDPSGTLPMGNCSTGISAAPFTATIVGSFLPDGRNVVSNNGVNGILCMYTSPVEILNSFGYCNIQGNNVGTDVSGLYGMPNDQRNLPGGLQFIMSDVTVYNNETFSIVGLPFGASDFGGCTGACNLVNGGILRARESGTVGIFNNYIGPKQTGDGPLANRASGGGVFVYLGGDTLVGGALDIGSLVSGGNLISGLACGGISAGQSLLASASNTIVIEGNLIGTDSGGNFAVPNNANSVCETDINSAVYLQTYFGQVSFGGSGPFGRNVVAGNAGNGVSLTPDYLGSLSFVNNYVGLSKSGADLGNSANGVIVAGRSQFAIQDSFIYANGKAGILVDALPGQDVTYFDVVGTSIAHNAGLGIDLKRTPNPYQNDGVNENDCFDADEGVNSLQNYPELLAPVFNQDGTVTVEGLIATSPNETLRLDFFANSDADSTEHGEGEIFIGSKTVVTGDNGLASFSFTSTSTVAPGRSIASTATNSRGQISEFSCIAGGCTGNIADLAQLTEARATCSVDLVVNVATDDDDLAIGDGNCDVDEATPGSQCSLRAAIQEANARSDVFLISFDIPGTGVHTIVPLNPLPPINKKVYLNAETESDYAGSPLIELKGGTAGVTNGFVVNAGGRGTTIRGFSINGFAGTGVVVGGNSVRVEDSYVGLKPDGLTFDSRQAFGIRLNGVNDAVVGNTLDTDTVISGNDVGVLIDHGNSNLIAATLIGTDKDGNSPVDSENQRLDGNRLGIEIESSTSNIVRANVVSSNAEEGILVKGSSNQVLNNKVGTNKAGTVTVRNGGSGIVVANGAQGNLFGLNLVSGNAEKGFDLQASAGTDNSLKGNIVGLDAAAAEALPNKIGINVNAPKSRIGVANGGNTIAANLESNVVLDTGTGNLSGSEILSNFIGTNSSGANFVNNDGLKLKGDGSGIVIRRNRIFFNRLGVHLQGVDFTVGTDLSVSDENYPTNEKNEIGRNYLNGVWIDENSSHNVVGDNLIEENKVGVLVFGDKNRVFKNVISGSQEEGVRVEKTSSIDLQENSIEYNRIGTDQSGGAARANDCGVRLTNGARGNYVNFNILSGNTNYGLAIGLGAEGGGGPSKNYAGKNKIGIDRDGTAAIPNKIGILLGDGAFENVIGETKAGSPYDENVISGNTGAGVLIGKIHPANLPAPHHNEITGNKIGFGLSGLPTTPALPNRVGIMIANGANNNIIGGYEYQTSSTFYDGNFIAGNTDYGVKVCPAVDEDYNCPAPGDEPSPFGNQITGNFIGAIPEQSTPLSGHAMANGRGGIFIRDSADNSIGKPPALLSYGNLIVANGGDGIHIEDSGLSRNDCRTRNNLVYGNKIGKNPLYPDALGNTGNGIYVQNAVLTKIVDNQIVDSGANGVVVKSGFTDAVAEPDALLTGNRIGIILTPNAPTIKRGNAFNGILIEDAPNVEVGSPQNPLTAKNIIGDNRTNGIVVRGANSFNIKIRNNLIGIAPGSEDIGNAEYGIRVLQGSRDNVFSGNTIANNAVNDAPVRAAVGAANGGGILIDATAGVGNLINANSIFGNNGLGIDLNGPGTTPNDPDDPDEGANRGQNFPEVASFNIDGNGDLIVAYRVDSAPANSNYGASGLYVEFFIADGTGQGRDLLGFDYYTVADHDGALAGTKIVNLGNAAGLGITPADKITAIATDADGNSSEFTPVFVPTAATVALGGRVRTADGQAISGARLTLRNLATNETKTARSNNFGNFRFDGLPADDTYLLTVESKGWRFDANPRVIQLLDNIEDLVLTGQ
ncbi:MAG: right-handed parallel beta-helix repeat-containing protein [Acidobacteria bacterium]|nr:right-handed parallel beta-helix repeat-containing protein [Acidobacteriota bacterium]